MKAAKPSDLEMQILSVLWNRGASTAREVLEAMPDGKQRAYTSILSVMQVMEKKGLLRHTNRGVAHVYSPTISQKKVIRPFMRRIVDEVFGGRPAAMMQALLTETPVDDEEFAQIQQLLQQARGPKQTRAEKGDEK
jgi:predicted transcriptional regulator